MIEFGGFLLMEKEGKPCCLGLTLLHNKKQALKGACFLLCRRRELNPHLLRDTILSRARLPIPPLRRHVYYST